MERNRTTAANSALIGIYNLLFIGFLVLILYVAQDVLIPIVTALLLTLLFSPFISYLERWLGRVLSISIFVIVLFILSGLGGYTFFKQAVNLSHDLPKYSENIQTKLQALQLSTKKFFSPFSFSLEEGRNTNQVSNNINSKVDTKKNATTNDNVVPVKIINPPSNIGISYQFIFGSILSFLGYTILVMVLLFFMLYSREDLRGRILHIIGKKQISSYTKAIEDASERVSKYLLSLLVVNIFYGVIISIGLSIIGISNAPLWGIMGGILRFIPYAGFMISAFFPILSSFLISDGYLLPLQTISFYLIVEVIITYLIEPVLYGNKTGVSPIALIIATIFWTWLWGTMGLVLAVPLTVCLVVIGKHIPRFEFLNVLMSGVPSLSFSEDLYLRIMRADLNYVMVAVDNYLKEHTILEFYDEVLIPIIIDIEKDYINQSLTIDQKEWILQIITDMIEELDLRPENIITNDKSYKDCKVLCIGAHAVRDDLATLILSQLLSKLSFEVNNLLAKDAIAGLMTIVEENKPVTVCISIIWPTSILHAKYICAKLQKNYPDIKIIIGLWHQDNLDQAEVQRLKNAGANYVVVTMREAITQVIDVCTPKAT